MRSSQKFLILFCYLTLYVVWGSTYFSIKLAVETIPPFYVVGLRYAIGGLLLLGLSGLSGRLKALPSWREVLASVFLGMLLLIGGNGLVTIAEQKVDSYLVALALASAPVLVAFFDRILLGKRISRLQLIGIVVGVTGVALLLYNGQSIASSLSPEMLTALGGVVSWSLATSLGHRTKGCRDPLVSSGVQMLFVGIVCLAGVSFLYPPLPQIVPQVSTQSALGLLYLAVIGSLAFGAYTYLISHEPAIRVTSYALVNPVIATLLGLLIGNESVVPLLALGLPLILLGVALMLYGEPVRAVLARRLGRRGAPG